MELKKAIERLNKEKEQLIDAIKCSLSGISERNDWGGLVQAIDTVLVELKESKKENSGKWKPKEHEQYWFRDTAGDPCYCYYAKGKSNHDWKINNLSIFPTKEECQKYWNFMDTVKEKSYEFSKEEWENDKKRKYYIFYSHSNCYFRVYSDLHCKGFGTVYFKTIDDAQYIIDNFKEELMTYWL